MVVAGNELIRRGLKGTGISVEGAGKEYVNPASLDLPMTNGKVYKTSKIFNNPTKDHLENNSSFRGYLEDIVLEKGELYIVEGPKVGIMEGVSAKTDTRSTAGRLGLMVDVLCNSEEENNHPHLINRVPEGFEGRLFYRIEPRIPMKLEGNDAITQMRFNFFEGAPKKEGSIGHQQLHDYYGRSDEKGMRLYDIVNGEEEMVPQKEAVIGDRTLFTADTRKAAVLKPNVEEPIEFGKKEQVDSHKYWDLITKEEGESLKIGKDEFTLLSTKEVVDTREFCWTLERVADIIAKKMEVHRAGFGDPGFKGEITLEIMNSHRPMDIYHGQSIAEAKWGHVFLCTEMYEGSYQGQPLALSKQFKKHDDESLWENEGL